MADSMFECIQIIKALTDESRVRILLALRDRQLCVCQITAMLDLAPSTTSKHLSILRQVRLIERQKKGKWVYYSIATDKNFPLGQKAINFIIDAAGKSTAIAEDELHILEMLALADDCLDDVCHSIAIHSLEKD